MRSPTVTMMRYALVSFPSEKNSRYVVSVSDVDDFKPKGRDDFDPKALYKVRWPVLKRADSVTSNPDDFYDAFIILLAASHRSMVDQAKKKKIRLPKAYAVTVEKEKALDNISSVSSSRAKKQVATALEKAKKDRMVKIINANKGGKIFKPEMGNKEPPSPTFSSSKADGVVQQIEGDQCKENNSICGETPSRPSESMINVVRRSIVFGDSNSETLNKGKENGDSKRIKCDGQSESVLKEENLRTRTEGKTQELFNFNDEEGGETEGSSLITMEKGETKGREGSLLIPSKEAEKDHVNSACRTKRKRKKVNTELSASDDDDCSYIESASERRRLSDQVIELQSKLTAELKKSRKFESELFVMQQQYNSLKEAFEQLSAALSSAYETMRTVTKDVEECRDTAESCESPEKEPPKSKVYNWLEQQQSSTSPGIQAAEGKLNEVKSKVYNWLEQQQQQSSTVPGMQEKTGGEPKVGKEEDVVGTPKINEKPVQKSQKVRKSPLNKINSPRKSPRKSPHKSPKKRTKNKMEGFTSYHDNKILGHTIYKALINEVPLPVNTTGKVLLGNDIWLTQDFWKNISSSSKDLSKTVQNLAEKIWGFKKCAQFSLTGGKSPNLRGDATSKEAAPPGEVEAILGFYRAKLLESGIQIGAILDQTVEKVGRGYLRSKFHNCAKKLNREMSKAEKFADKEMDMEDN